MTNTFRNIEDIQLRKEELRVAIEQRSDAIANLWTELTTVKKSDDKGRWLLASSVRESWHLMP